MKKNTAILWTVLINILFALNVHSHNAFSVPGPNSQVQVPGPRCPDISAIAQGNLIVWAGIMIKLPGLGMLQEK